MRRKIVVVGIVVGIAAILLFLPTITQLQAQSTLTLESLSRRVDAISSRINTLNRHSARKSEVEALQHRVATLEARLADPTPVATATRKRPTATSTRRPPTPTRVRPTATPTPAQAYIRITRNMNVRLGPDTTYAVVGYATIGQEFDITGRNANGSWWRIEFEGENAWIYAPYVTAVNARGIRVVPTPALPPTPRPQPTPETQYSSTEYAMVLLGMDWNREDLQRRWGGFSEDEKALMLVTIAAYLELTAEYCNMSLQDAGRMINKHGQYLDDTGYTIRNDMRARSFLMLVLTEAEEAPHTPYGCDNWLGQATSRLLVSE